MVLATPSPPGSASGCEWDPSKSVFLLWLRQDMCVHHVLLSRTPFRTPFTYPSKEKGVTLTSSANLNMWYMDILNCHFQDTRSYNLQGFQQSDKWSTPLKDHCLNHQNKTYLYRLDAVNSGNNTETDVSFPTIMALYNDHCFKNLKTWWSWKLKINLDDLMTRPCLNRIIYFKNIYRELLQIINPQFSLQKYTPVCMGSIWMDPIARLQGMRRV